MYKIFAGTGLVLIVGLYFVTSWGLTTFEDLQEQKYITQQQQRKTASLKKEQSEWDLARVDLNINKAKLQHEFNKLQKRFNNVSYKTQIEFFDIGVPADVISILRDSDAPALRRYLAATTTRPADPNTITAAYNALTNADVYSNREAYIKALQSCNADKLAMYNKYYPP